MKKIIYVLTIVIINLPIILNCQVVSTVINSVSKTQSPFFSDKKSTISFDLIKEFKFNELDTNYYINISIINISVEVTSVSISTGLLSSVGVSGKRNELIGAMNIDKSNFSQLYECISNAFKYVQIRKETKNHIILSCPIQKGAFQIDLDANGNISYIFTFENVLYNMNESDFKNIISLFNKAKPYLLSTP